MDVGGGIVGRVPRRKAHRKRRERRQHFGDLVQLDGSFHAWFEERGPRGCLMNMVDDATATTCCRLGEQETIWAAVGCCARGSRSMAYHERGIPIGRTFISGSRPKGSACVGKRPRRSCCQFSASERAGRAQQRGTSRSAGEETASPGDPELRSYE